MHICEFGFFNNGAPTSLLLAPFFSLRKCRFPISEYHDLSNKKFLKALMLSMCSRELLSKIGDLLKNEMVKGQKAK